MLRSFTGGRRAFRLFGSILVVVALVLAVSGPPVAVGQATRTWVSGVGDDANPCSRTAPCKTFAGAISKTAAAGEINCLDPGGFGGVTITKSITIECRYTEGGVLSAGAGVNGIVINAGVNDVVSLAGLDFNGVGSAQNGIRFLAGAALHVENVTIRGYRASNGTGISFQPSGASELDIRNSSITDNGTGTTGAGILIQPTGANGSAKVTLTNVDISNNAQGLRAVTTGNTSALGAKVTITGSSATGNQTAGFAAVTTVGSSPVEMMVQDSVASYNVGAGFTANGSSARIRIGGSVVTGNGTGTLEANSGIIQSYQTNQIDGNTADGTRTNIPLE
jgi:hypothetical protein